MIDSSVEKRGKVKFSWNIYKMATHLWQSKKKDFLGIFDGQNKGKYVFFFLKKKKKKKKQAGLISNFSWT